MLLNLEKVKAILPHRDPFLFIDAVESITYPQGIETISSSKDLIGTEVVAHYHTRPEHDIFRGHFPGNPVLPGVIQVEMMAQASTFAILKLLPDPFNTKLDVALLTVQEAKFRKPILPQMDLKIVSVLAKARGQMLSYDCKIWLLGEHQESQLMSETSLLASAKF